MSRQNKVNPGMYTQRGRLTQDDAARELRKQSAITSPHTWQGVNSRTSPRLPPASDGPRASETSADNASTVKTPPNAETGRASRVTRNVKIRKAAPSSANAKATAKTAGTRKSKRAASLAKSGKATKTALRQPTPKRKGARARNRSGRAVSRPTTKRRTN